jgi:hypothetical protein
MTVLAKASSNLPGWLKPDSVKVVTQKNMVKGPRGLRNKNDCAGKSQQHFTQLTKVTWLSAVRHKNMAMGPMGYRIKDDCAGKTSGNLPETENEARERHTWSIMTQESWDRKIWSWVLWSMEPRTAVPVGSRSKALHQTEAKATEDRSTRESHCYWRSLQSNEYVKL